ncbi:MAG: flagellar hook protein FlgE [Pseudomonadota bacterium]|jgi:flagellar hook protein FlgE
MSFQQGLSGLNATSKNLEVIGNNVANANTFGAKSSRAEFADMVAASLNGAVSSIPGIGTNLEAIAQQFTPGNLKSTENPLDLAINGGGFFQVDDNGATHYTRNGQFKLDRDGFFVNNQSQKLLGYVADNQGVIQPGLATPMRMSTSGINPQGTTAIKLEFNLDARSKSTVPVAGSATNLSDATDYNNATSVVVYDEKGQDIALTYYFQKAATDTWNVFVTANGVPISANAAGDPLPSTTIVFPADGSAPASPLNDVPLDIPVTTNSVGAQTVPILGLQLNLSGATQWGSKFGVTNVTQDGYAPGQLVGLQFETNGVITARYSNGQTKSAGQVELANFRNVQGLTPLGGNSWGRTYSSGDPIVGVPGDGNLGALQSGALEESNVDLTAELVNMITAQRIYQANAQTIKTQDQVLQTLVNLR